mgnify:CR=1 FL=1|tara:strand:+ start:168595 stop:169242 length:648 start_codon:yes stop_codon:yes gene_type:complete
MNKKLLMVLIVLLTLNFQAFGDENSSTHQDNNEEHSENDGHNHKKKKSHSEDEHKKEGHKHESEDEHKDGDEEEHGHGHGDETSHKEDEHGHGHGGGGKAVGEGKAIVEISEEKGFKLSKEAIKTLELKLLNVDSDEFLIEKTTLVTSKKLKGVYRFRGGFFKLLPVELKKEVDGKYLVKVKGVDFGDQIVINGVGLLRVADVYSTDKAEYSHSH